MAFAQMFQQSQRVAGKPRVASEMHLTLPKVTITASAINAGMLAVSAHCPGCTCRPTHAPLAEHSTGALLYHTTSTFDMVCMKHV